MHKNTMHKPEAVPTLVHRRAV